MQACSTNVPEPIYGRRVHQFEPSDLSSSPRFTFNPRTIFMYVNSVSDTRVAPLIAPCAARAKCSGSDLSTSNHEANGKYQYTSDLPSSVF